MATITSRKRHDGTTAHMAQIVLKRKGKVVHRENKTFDRKQAAYAWAQAREEELKAPGGLEGLKAASVTLGDAIDKYLATSVREFGRTKHDVLRRIKTFDIADMPCREIRSSDLMDFATELSKTRAPSTVANYMSHLSAIFSVARPAWGYELSEQAMRDTLKVTKRLGVTGRSNRRERRPTLDELDQLMTYWQEAYNRHRRRYPRRVPMHKIVAFAIFSSRRQEEITRLLWEDLDGIHKRILVRDMKDPEAKHGNHVLCELTDEAFAIIQSMPKVSPRIFPFDGDTIGYRFHTACKFYGIKDLRFHDLRHEGISRLFELGRTLPQVASVSGHKSWHSLRRYTHIRHAGDKYEGWRWLSLVTNGGEQEGDAASREADAAAPVRSSDPLLEPLNEHWLEMASDTLTTSPVGLGMQAETGSVQSPSSYSSIEPELAYKSADEPIDDPLLTGEFDPLNEWLLDICSGREDSGSDA